MDHNTFIGRVAIVHDYLTQTGGAERLVLALVSALPGASVYTSVYDPGCTFSGFAGLEVRVPPLGRLVRPAAFRWYAPLYPLLFSSLELSGFETVLVSSSAFAHHVRHPRVFVYCHTPPRFLYQPGSYTRSLGRAGALRVVTAPAKALDRRAAVRARSYAANSEVTRRRIADVYGLDAAVIHPPVSTGHLPAVLPPLPTRPQALVVSRLLPYKRVDVAVRACVEAGIPVRVVGDGPERGNLERIAGPGVELLGRVDDTEMAKLYANASVVLAPGVEDFGFAPVEAHWAGRPVVAVADGGALETVTDGVDGLLVHGHETHRWAAAVREVHERSWDPARLRVSAEQFSLETFVGRIRNWITGPAQ